MIKQFCIFILAMPLLFLSCDIVEGGGSGETSSSESTEHSSPSQEEQNRKKLAR